MPETILAKEVPPPTTVLVLLAVPATSNAVAGVAVRIPTILELGSITKVLESKLRPAVAKPTVLVAASLNHKSLANVVLAECVTAPVRVLAPVTASVPPVLMSVLIVVAAETMPTTERQIATAPAYLRKSFFIQKNN